MRNFIITTISLVTSFYSFSQAIAYPAILDSYAVSTCIDLTVLNATVKGHQLAYNVDYFLTQDDAQNNSNAISPFYTYSSYNETLYARVTNNILSSDFATSEITIILQSLPCCPPPPPGYNSFTFCDTNNDGVELANLENLRYIISYGNPPSLLCDLDESYILITYYTSQSDANNDINSINKVYAFTENTEIFYKTKSTINSASYTLQFGIRIQTCTSIDSDDDGIQDYNEDVNKNGSYFDDDTDGDGLKNYEDSDDDNDLVLTINEDYNGNGDPIDDDTNGNGIADYLESSVTLSMRNLSTLEFSIAQNPVSNTLEVLLNNNNDIKKLSIFDLNGKLIFINNLTGSNSKIDVSAITSGLYFLKLESEEKVSLKKFIKK